MKIRKNRLMRIKNNNRMMERKSQHPNKKKIMQKLQMKRRKRRKKLRRISKLNNNTNLMSLMNPKHDESLTIFM